MHLTPMRSLILFLVVSFTHCCLTAAFQPTINSSPLFGSRVDSPAALRPPQPLRFHRWLQSAVPLDQQSAEGDDLSKRQRFALAVQRRMADLREQRAETLAKLRDYGVSAVLCYGVFDLITYSGAFLIALATYSKTTGEALTIALLFSGQLHWKVFPTVLGMMWLFNNSLRPLRIFGALAGAPYMDRYVVKPTQRSITNLKARYMPQSVGVETTPTPSTASGALVVEGTTSELDISGRVVDLPGAAADAAGGTVRTTTPTTPTVSRVEE
ncbi:unnamed protein product [Vitrella brassicaformis CCMP3155]|uniref:DUF1279 domain-containing protein n=1 Tax=Vitrella brassicaformis (strain CCMP3155) TaxID=1169540 RepID=A0A0G4EGM5_VITBC|nr:unnamed protein product [Vitrella brassicaformis CCMP3155]|eukprot:CEL94613.1 unnamed protein product [Vitrella brassicaformis CCMP3155]